MCSCTLEERTMSGGAHEGLPMPPSLTLDAPAGTTGDAAAPIRRTRIFALSEARWAAAALALFLLALPFYLWGLSAWTWGPLFALCYAAGGWEPGLAGLRALRDRTL